MLRGRRTVVYLSDMLKLVEGLSATFHENHDGSTTVNLVLPDGSVRQHILPRSVRLVDDTTKERIE